MPEKTPASHRWGGPGSSHEDRSKPEPSPEERAAYRPTRHSQVSGGGGEADVHHDKDPKHKRHSQAGKDEKRQH
jgi:hypothetical protein